MYLTEFHLRNFRSITKLSLQNLHSINCFIGGHNTGKTNILDGISIFWDAYIRAKIQQKLLRANLGQQINRDFDRNILSYLGDSTSVQGDFILSINHDMRDWLRNEQLNEYFTLTAGYYKYKKAKDFLQNFIDETSSILSLEKIKALEFKLTLNPEFLSFVEENLFFHLKNGEEIKFLSDDLPVSVIQQAIGSAFFRRFHDIASEYDILHDNLVRLIKNKKYNELATIERFLKEIIDQEFVFELGQSQGDQQEIEVTIERVFASPLWRISPSTIRIIALAYMLTTKDFNHIIILDEPETHLHPRGERKLARKIESLSSMHQIFFSTHSTRFLIGHAYLVDLRKGWTYVHPIRGEKSMKKVVKLLGVRPSDTFGSDVVVFVEGRTDARVYRVFETLLNQDLSTTSMNRISYIGVGGWTNMKFILSIELLKSKFVRSRAVAITDGDIRFDSNETYLKVKKSWNAVFPEGTFLSLEEESIESLFLNNADSIIRLAFIRKVDIPSIDEIKGMIAKKRNRGISDKQILREIAEKHFGRRYSSSFAEMLAKAFKRDEIPSYLADFFFNHVLI